MLKKAIAFYRGKGLLSMPDDEWAYNELYENGFTMKWSADRSWATCIELERGWQ